MVKFYKHDIEKWFPFIYIMNIKHSYCSEQLTVHAHTRHEGHVKEIVKKYFSHQMNSINPQIICPYTFKFLKGK